MPPTEPKPIGSEKPDWKPIFDQIYLSILIALILFSITTFWIIIDNRKTNCLSEAALNGGLSAQPDFCFDFDYSNATKKD